MKTTTHPILYSEFNGFALWGTPKSSDTWWITTFTITHNGSEVFRSHPSGCLPGSVLKQWWKTTKLIPSGKFNPKHGSCTYTHKGAEYIPSGSTFVRI